MKILFDTSVIIAALVESHPMHQRAFPWLRKAKAKKFEMIVASHTIAELYAVLSTLPTKPRISPLTARKLISENIEPNSKIVSLTPEEYKSVIKQISELGLVGGSTYDALIAKVAQKSRAEKLLTLNIDHFNRAWPAGQKTIILPWRREEFCIEKAKRPALALSESTPLHCYDTAINPPGSFFRNLTVDKRGQIYVWLLMDGAWLVAGKLTGEEAWMRKAVIDFNLRISGHGFSRILTDKIVLVRLPAKEDLLPQI